MISPSNWGVLSGYEDLIRAYMNKLSEDNALMIGLYYGRFVGLWALALVLVLASQWHSWQSTKMIRLRLAGAQESAKSEKGQEGAG